MVKVKSRPGIIIQCQKTGLFSNFTSSEHLFLINTETEILFKRCWFNSLTPFPDTDNMLRYRWAEPRGAWWGNWGELRLWWFAALLPFLSDIKSLNYVYSDKSDGNELLVRCEKYFWTRRASKRFPFLFYSPFSSSAPFYPASWRFSPLPGFWPSFPAASLSYHSVKVSMMRLRNCTSSLPAAAARAGLLLLLSDACWELESFLHWRLFRLFLFYFLKLDLK